MSVWEVILIAVGLAMDAFAVSVCKGLASGKVRVKNMLICGVWFGGFQMLMPFIGFALASIFAEYIRFITPWISFALLAFLGVKMIVESVLERKKEKREGACPREDCAENERSEYGFVTMLLLAIATSIDALAVGVTFAFNGVSYNIAEPSNIWLYIAIIGLASFLIPAAGNAVGSGLGAAFGVRFKFIAGLLGGVILCAIGVKFLVEGIVDVTSASAAQALLSQVVGAPAF